jgi:hypothetical protein
VAQSIEDGPFIRIGLKPLPIGGKIREAEFFRAAFEPLADLAMDFPEPLPAEVKTRQRPLQQGYAIGISHGLAPLGMSRGLSPSLIYRKARNIGQRVKWQGFSG